MKLKKFNAERNRGYHQLQAMVSVNVNGCWSFNKKAIEDLNLKVKAKLNLLQDGDNPVDWFMELTQENEGLMLREYRNKQILVTNKEAARELFAALGLKNSGKKSVRIPIATEPVEGGYYALITKKVITENPVNKL